ncbi:MAG TPA: hypothetical protein VFJ47_13930 [Terriglobales bacterium]|nr:hypothetical protein [Terriglobales bacterium]
MCTAVKIKVMAGVAAIGMLSFSAAAETLNPHLAIVLAASQQDSAEKPAAEDKTAQADSGKQNSEDKSAQEKRAQEEPKAKPAPEPPPPTKPGDNPQSQPAENPNQTAPAQSPNAAPGSNPSGSPAPEANPAAPVSPAPTSENAPANPNAPAPPKPSPTVTSKPQNGGTASSKRRVIREGGTGDANAMLAPSMTAEQASRQRENTTRLLNSADTNLQKITGRQLNPDKQAAVDQIRTYMQQAKDALSRGDLQRSHNLALKANLLSEDLARH